MKLIYKNIGHVLRLGDGYAVELIVEHRNLFFNMVTNLTEQIDGGRGDAVLSLSDKPVELGRYADITVQFAPFQLNRKTLLTKLCATLEQKALQAENYVETGELLSQLEAYVHTLAFDLPFEIDCKKVAISPILKAISPEIDENEKSTIERVFAYMELLRELDRDRLFIMVNMRSYFSDEDMERFIESACLHDFKVLLLESTSRTILKNTKRYTIDADLCEF